MILCPIVHEIMLVLFAIAHAHLFVVVVVSKLMFSVNFIIPITITSCSQLLLFHIIM